MNWTDYSGTVHTTPLNINCHCFNPTTTQVLNPAAFTNVPNGQFAANQASIRCFRGPRIPSENANFSRNFRVQGTLQFPGARGVHEYFQPHDLASGIYPRSDYRHQRRGLHHRSHEVHFRPEHGLVQRRLRHHRSGDNCLRSARRHTGRPLFVLVGLKGRAGDRYDRIARGRPLDPSVRQLPAMTQQRCGWIEIRTLPKLLQG